MREIDASNGVMQTVAEDQLNEAVFVCAKDGLLVCPQTGIALAGVRHAVERGYIQRGEKVVVVSTATGLKFGDVFESRSMERIERAADTSPSTIARMLKL